MKKREMILKTLRLKELKKRIEELKKSGKPSDMAEVSRLRKRVIMLLKDILEEVDE